MEDPKIPFTRQPHTITNYTHFKTLLQSRLKSRPSHKYPNIFPAYLNEKIKKQKIIFKKQPKPILPLLNSYLQNSLQKLQTEDEKMTKIFFNKIVKKNIKESMQNFQRQVHVREKIRLDDVGLIEAGVLDKSHFSSHLLVDAYEFLDGELCAVEYLEMKYREFVVKYLRENNCSASDVTPSHMHYSNGPNISYADGANDGPKMKYADGQNGGPKICHNIGTNGNPNDNQVSSPKMMNYPNTDNERIFAGLKYAQDDFNTEIYEKRPLYAEIYTHLRSGTHSKITPLLKKYNFFFDTNCNGFYFLMTEYVENKILSVESKRHALYLFQSLPPNADRFKRIILKILCQSAKFEDDPVINTLEDFLWLQLVTLGASPIRINTESRLSQANLYQKKANKESRASFETRRNEIRNERLDELKTMLRDFQNESGKLFAYILLGFHAEAVESLLKANFFVYECFYITKKIIEKYKTNTKYFVYLTFMICTHFKSNERKVVLIKDLKNLLRGEYCETVAEYVVKFGLLEILEDGMFEKEVLDLVGRILRENGDNEKILKYAFLFDDADLVLSTLSDEIKEIILDRCTIYDYNQFASKHDSINTNKKINYGIKNDNIDTKNSLKNYITMIGNIYKSFSYVQSTEKRKCDILYKLLIFKMKMDEESLRNTIIFDQEADPAFLADIGSVIEKILILACKVIKKTNNINMGRDLVCFMSKVKIGDENVNLINAEMIDFI